MKFQPAQLFSEPGGWDAARVSILTSLAFFGIYAFFEFLHGSGLASMLVIGVAMGLSGGAEFLPPNRVRVAGAIRLLAVGLLVALVGVLLFAPEVAME